jgi:hypothetical protein
MIHINRYIELELNDLYYVEDKNQKGFIKQLNKTFSAKYMYDKEVEIDVDEENQEIRFVKNGVVIRFKLKSHG